MPEGNVLESRLGVGADHPGESADLLTGNRIALVRHGRRAFLFLTEKLFGFADFGTLHGWRISVAMLSSVQAMTAKVAR